MSGNEQEWVYNQATIKAHYGITDAGMAAAGLTNIKSHEEASAAASESQRIVVEAAMAAGQTSPTFRPGVHFDPTLQARAGAIREEQKRRPKSLLDTDPEFQKWRREKGYAPEPGARRGSAAAKLLIALAVVLSLAAWAFMKMLPPPIPNFTSSHLATVERHQRLTLSETYARKFADDPSVPYSKMGIDGQAALEGAWLRVSANLGALEELSPEQQAFYDRIFRERLNPLVQRRFPTAIADLERLERERPMP